MFCTKCGHKAVDGNQFCTGCGQRLEAAPATAAPMSSGNAVCVAVHLKVGMIKREPWALWMSPGRGAMIRIGEERYAGVTGFCYKNQSGLGEEGFRRYVQSLAAAPLESVLAGHPGSAAFAPAQIRSMQICATYDSDLCRYDDYERFILETTAERYRGGFEKQTKLQALMEMLEAVLGSRYRYRTMSGYPFL